MSYTYLHSDRVDRDMVYLIPMTGDGRMLAVAEHRRGRPPYWFLPAARRSHPGSAPAPVVQRILNTLRLEHTGLRELTAAAPAECRAAVYTVSAAWSDRQPQFLAGSRHLLHALPGDEQTLRTLDLRPAWILDLLIHDGIDTCLASAGGSR